MFLREDVRHCETCGESTSHSRRVVAGPVLLAGAIGVAAIAVGVAGASEGDAWLGVLALLLGVSAVAVWRWDRDRYLWVACGRCRGKLQTEARRRWPRFDGNTERFFCMSL